MLFDEICKIFKNNYFVHLPTAASDCPVKNAAVY